MAAMPVCTKKNVAHIHRRGNSWITRLISPCCRYLKHHVSVLTKFFVMLRKPLTAGSHVLLALITRLVPAFKKDLESLSEFSNMLR